MGPSTSQGGIARVTLTKFRDVLRDDSIGATDDFFEQGGDSVDAMLLIGRLRAELDQSLRMTDLVRNPTAEQLAEAIAERLD